MERLSIDEIIEHCKRKRTTYEKVNGIEMLETKDISNTFTKEYWEHRQVAEYLLELQQYRSIGTVKECTQHKNILEFLFNTINPNEMEKYMTMYHATGEKQEVDG